jgi:transposase-like protein
MRMTDDEAHDRFEQVRFESNGGAAFCPHCECTKIYTYRARKLWKCSACGKQFTVTSGTIFASRKLPIRDYLAAIAIFVNPVKGVSALQLSRDLDVQYKTAFVMAHKIREAIGADRSNISLTGTVEIDGAYFGGKSKKEEPESRTGGSPVGRRTNWQTPVSCGGAGTRWKDLHDRSSERIRRRSDNPRSYSGWSRRPR